MRVSKRHCCASLSVLVNAFHASQKSFFSQYMSLSPLSPPPRSLSLSLPLWMCMLHIKHADMALALNSTSSCYNLLWIEPHNPKGGSLNYECIACMFFFNPIIKESQAVIKSCR